MITLSEEQVGRLLVGRRVRISVGEPWDFEGPEGPNAIRGHIAEVIPGRPDDRHSQQLKVDVTPFTVHGGHTVRWLTASGRYVDPTGIIEQLAAGEDADVNLAYADQVDEAALPPGKSPFLIGGMRLDDQQLAE